MASVKQGPLDETGNPPFALFPAIDLRGGRVVRLRQGDFDRETSYGHGSVATALGFAEAGATWLHIVDLDGARSGVPAQASVIAALARAVGGRIRLQVGGGLRDAASVASVLEAGAARAVVGTAALDDPGFAGRLIRRHGAERIAVALDVRDGQAVGQGWQAGARGRPVADAAMEMTDQGAETLIVTAIARDGLLEGPDLDLLGGLVPLTSASVVASGGIGSVADLLATRAVGCRGAIVGRALYEGRLDLAAALDALRA
jgi:phosphoribosylformimino-5-aminoimidazole carboxamide ribotide isomerase